MKLELPVTRLIALFLLLLHALLVFLQSLVETFSDRAERLKTKLTEAGLHLEKRRRTSRSRPLTQQGFLRDAVRACHGRQWLQPGGHADGDGFLQMVALREATEETGIVGLEVWSDPIDIDVHLIEKRSAAEPAHLHLDVRYLVKAPKGAVFRGNHESVALRWVGGDDLEDSTLSLDDSTKRVARYGFALAERLLN